MIFQLGKYEFEGEFTPTEYNKTKTNNLISYQLINGGNYLKKNGWRNAKISMQFVLTDILNGLTAREQLDILKELDDTTDALNFIDADNNVLGKYHISSFGETTAYYFHSAGKDTPLDYLINLELERTV